MDDAGLSLVTHALPTGERLSMALEQGGNLVLKVDRRSGYFRGQLRGTAAAKARTFSGVVVQPFKRGGGALMLDGPVGAVEIAVP